MFAGFFNLEKPFWRWMGKIPDIVLLSLFFYICCIPVVTIIPASCALFDAISRCTVPAEAGAYSRFWRTFLRELKSGIVLSLFWLVIALVALYGDWALHYNAANNETLLILSAVYRVLLLTMVCVLGWVVPLQSRYYHSFVRLHANALSFTVARLPGTLAMLFITVAVLVFSIAHPYTYLLLAFAPGLIALLHTPIVERGFKKAFPEDYPETGVTPEE